MSNGKEILKVIGSDQLLKLSASSIKTYQQCPRKYYFTYLEKPDIPERDWSHLTLGNFVHDVLEYFHNILLKHPNRDYRKLMSYCCKSKEKEESFLEKITPEMRKSIKEMLLAYLNELEETGLPNVQSNERSFNVKIDSDLLIRGKIDRIDFGTDDHPERYHVLDYKGLAVDTPIPTPNGWTTMEEVKVGDQVIGSDGRPVNVMVKSKIHNRPCYRITMSDKSQIVCDNVHLWSVGFRNNWSRGNYDEVLSADELFKRFSELEEGSFVINNPAPLELPSQDLPVDPWLLGAWLGDGISKCGGITVGSQDLLAMENLLEKYWGRLSVTKEKGKDVYTVTCVKPVPGACKYGHNRGGKKTCNICQNLRNKGKRIESFADPREQCNVPLCTILRENYLIKNKHIPKQYLRASFEQRQALLQGLMDTDGSWNPLRKRCVFVSAKEELAKSVVELIRTFGVTVQTFTATDKNGFVSYRIEFRPVGFEPFKLPRKAEAVSESFPEGVSNNHHASRRRIRNIEKIDSVPTQCITVDAHDSLYLCGEGVIPTHNSGSSRYLDEFQLLVYGIPLLDDDPALESYQGTYLALKENMKKISYTFTKTDIERVKDKIRGIARQIREDSTWEPRPQFLCNWCDYETVCEAAPNNRKRGGRTKPFVGGEIDWD